MFNRHVKYGLGLLGAWPGVEKSKRFFTFYMIFITFGLVFQIWDTFVVYGRIDLLVYNLGATLPCLSTALKVMVFRMKTGQAKLLVEEMLRDWNSKEGVERKVMVRNVKIADRIIVTILICYHGLVSSYLGVAILSYITGGVEDRKVVFQATFPIDVRESPLFEIVCTVQYVMAIYVVNGHALPEELITLAVLHTNTKTFAICQEILRFSDVCSNAKDRKRILEAKKSFIDKHLNFIHFAENIQDTFSYIAFFHLFLMTMVYCIVLYMLITVKTFNKENMMIILISGLHIVSLLFAVGAYCFAGEFLKSQNDSIYKAMMKIPWYEFEATDMKTVNFILIKRHSPVVLTLGHFSELSLVYFSQMIKTSFSYLSLMKGAGNE